MWQVAKLGARLSNDFVQVADWQGRLLGTRSLSRDVCVPRPEDVLQGRVQLRQSRVGRDGVSGGFDLLRQMEAL